MANGLLALWPKIKKAIASIFSDDPCGSSAYNFVPPTMVLEQLIDLVANKTNSLRLASSRARMDQCKKDLLEDFGSSAKACWRR